MLHHPHLLIALSAEIAIGANVFRRPIVILIPVDGGAVVHVEALASDACAANKFHLLGFLIVQCRGPRQRVHVVFVERLFGYGRSVARFVVPWPWRRLLQIPVVVGLYLVYVAGQQLDVSVFEDVTSAVVDRHPAHQIEHVTVFGSDQVVVRLPAHPAGDIREFGVESPGSSVCRSQVTVGFRMVSPVREGKIGSRAGRSEAALNLDQRLLIRGLGVLAVLDQGSNVAAADDPALRDEPSVSKEFDGASFVEGEQCFLGNRIVAVVLFQNLQRALAARIAQDQRLRLQDER